MQFTQSLDRDANRLPVYGDSAFTVVTTLVTNASNTTVNPPIFTLTGAVLLTQLFGVVTTDLGANHTAAYWRLNDQSAQVNITLNTGTALSGIKAGSLLVKKGLATAALTKIDNTAGAVSEPTTLETELFSPIILVKKTAAKTQIEYVYTTSTSPTSGAIEFHVAYIPLSSDGLLTAS